MDAKSLKRYDSFKRSLEALKEAKNRDPEDSFVLSGTTAKFTITYELAWKVMKDIVTQYYGISDFVIGSPKEVLKKAFQTRLIEDERAWLEMHELRNRIAHTYEETELAEIFHLIVGSYIDKMQELQKLIDSLPMLLEE